MRSWSARKLSEKQLRDLALAVDFVAVVVLEASENDQMEKELWSKLSVLVEDIFKALVCQRGLQPPTACS